MAVTSAAAGTPSSGASGVFWRYWAGSTISGLGTAVTSVALPLTAVLVAHASAFGVAAITASGSAPWLLLGFPAGVYVTRLPLRGTQVAMDLVRAGAIGSVPIVAWGGTLTVAQLIAVAFTVGSGSVIFSVANATMIPSIVPKEELTRRNSLTFASRGIAQLAGPGLGGLLVGAIGAASCMVIDTISYLISAVMLWLLPRPQPSPPATGNLSFRGQVTEGFAYISAHPALKATFLLAICVNLAGAAILALAPVYIVRTLHEHSFVLGLVYAAEGAGALAGAALAPRLSDRWGSARTLTRFTLPTPVAILLLPLAFHGWGAILFGLGIFLFAGSLSIVAIILITYQHRTVPTEMLPRLFATNQVVSWGGAPIGALTAGALAGLLDVRTALFTVAALSITAPLSVWSSPDMRHRINLEDD